MKNEKAFYEYFQLIIEHYVSFFSKILKVFQALFHVIQADCKQPQTISTCCVFLIPMYILTIEIMTFSFNETFKQLSYNVNSAFFPIEPIQNHGHCLHVYSLSFVLYTYTYFDITHSKCFNQYFLFEIDVAFRILMLLCAYIFEFFKLNRCVRL